MNIGPYTLDNPIALAPMAGVTDLPFRILCRKLGAGYVVGEMLSSDPSLRNSRKSVLRSNHEGEVEPISVQIAGSDPDWMAEAARYNVKLGAQIIDINMGCPAKKVCNRMAGSALLEDLELVQKILRTVVSSVDVPVTLKIRTGPDRERRNGVEVARIAQTEGISALAVHGRTRADRFKGEAEYRTISEICDAVDIPVFANGDLDDAAHAQETLHQTGADGLMVGRGAQGNPWIFREVMHFLATGKDLAPPSHDEVHTVLTGHLRALHDFYGELPGLRVARKHIGWYLKGRPGGSELRQKLMKVETAAEQIEMIDQHFNSPRRFAA
jgi:tRNA-dihydrouridine synthase B